jgi:hypothetical protein
MFTFFTITPLSQAEGDKIVYYRVAVRGAKPKTQLKRWLTEQRQEINSPFSGKVRIYRVSGKYAPYQPPGDSEIYLYPGPIQA